ncbi:MAG: hypothetical protein WBA17_04780 [Saprospiraceae bacterium]
MIALLELITSPANVVWTILLGIVLLYWLLVIAGAMTMDGLDIDLDIDADVDLDVDLDVESDLALGGGGLTGALLWFNFGRVPFMVIMSVAVLVGWVLAVWLNINLGNGSGWFALAAAPAVFIVGMLAAKFITTPLIPVFRSLNTAAEPVDFIGREARLRLPATPVKWGQAEVQIGGDNLLVNVKTLDDPLPSGTLVVITGRTEDGKYYLVRPLAQVDYEFT